MGKVSAKHFYNKRVNPIIDKSFGIQAYPLYIRIVYNRKSTEIKSRLHKRHESLVHQVPGIVHNDTLYIYPKQDNEAFNRHLDKTKRSYANLNQLMKAEEQLIKAMHTFFTTNFPEPYPLKSFNDTIDFAMTPIGKILNDACMFVIRARLEQNKEYYSVLPLIDLNPDFNAFVNAVKTMTKTDSNSLSNFGNFFLKITKELTEAIKIIYSLVSDKNQPVIFCLNQGLEKKIEDYKKGGLDNLPTKTQKGIIKSLDLISFMILKKGNRIKYQTKELLL